MSWLNIRQGLVAMNIANADKPRYKPLDMYEQAFKLTIDRKKLEMATTNPLHVSDRQHNKKDDESTTVGPSFAFLAKTYSGNSVSVEEQAQKLQRIALEFSYATNMYKSYRKALDLTLSLGKTG